LPDSVAPRALKSHTRPSLIDISRPLHDLTDDLIGQIEREYFIRLLGHFQGNVARSARHCGLSRRSVAQKLQKYGLDRRHFKKPKYFANSETETMWPEPGPFLAPGVGPLAQLTALPIKIKEESRP
jgi:hypothetical protein